MTSGEVPAALAGKVRAATVGRYRAARAGKVPLTERERSERRLGLWLCGPAALLMAVVVGWPLVHSVLLSMRRHDPPHAAGRGWVGLDNYGLVLADGSWWTALSITFVIVGLSVAAELVLGMAIALVMHRTIVARGLVRAVVLIPYGIVTVAAAYGWRYAWTPEFGWLANLLPSGATPTGHWPAIGAIVLAEVWKTTPFMALLLMAGLALVPEELLRAAAADGATAPQCFRRVVLPLIRPALLVALLLCALGAFRIFDNVFVLTGGAHGTGSVSVTAYEELVRGSDPGVGATMSVLILATMTVVAIVFVKGLGAAPGGPAAGALGSGGAVSGAAARAGQTEWRR